ncbi:hypothetical protein TNIN_208551 [Trichonephila inaurata madagascariensis]|uniref:Uncharacterized protein n=1 Tax=Trichonephila inaurata madagascariensis TaxID=2747483 RepID=A0A8X6XTN3_9ARAC|nr:hypothetical protein TNIN_208551 [Trichonephila inaurata madagascariensis]
MGIFLCIRKILEILCEKSSLGYIVEEPEQESFSEAEPEGPIVSIIDYLKRCLGNNGYCIGSGYTVEEPDQGAISETAAEAEAPVGIHIIENERQPSPFPDMDDVDWIFDVEEEVFIPVFPQNIGDGTRNMVRPRFNPDEPRVNRNEEPPSSCCRPSR